MDEQARRELYEQGEVATAFFRWAFPPAMAFSFAAALTPALFWGLLH